MTITPEQLQAMRADAARHASVQAEVPSCDFTARAEPGGGRADEWWAFAEIHGDFHKGRYLYLCAPADVVDGTAPERFASAIVAARAAVPALASDVLTLVAEVERLTARIATLEAAAAPTRGSLSVAYNSACARRVEAEEALRRAPMGKRGEEAQRRLADALADEAAKRAALDAYDREHGEPGRVTRDADDPCPGSRGW